MTTVLPRTDDERRRHEMRTKLTALWDTLEHADWTVHRIPLDDAPREVLAALIAHETRRVNALKEAP